MTLFASTYFKRWSTDYIGHGWKRMGRDAWATRTGPNPNCSQMKLEDEFEVAKRNCWWVRQASLAKS
jgi:hypothetical protein